MEFHVLFFLFGAGLLCSQVSYNVAQSTQKSTTPPVMSSTTPPTGGSTTTLPKTSTMPPPMSSPLMTTQTLKTGMSSSSPPPSGGSTTTLPKTSTMPPPMTSPLMTTQTLKTGMSSPSPPQSNGSTSTLPKLSPMTSPVMTTQTPLKSIVTTTKALPVVTYPCPKECQTCQLYLDITGNCMAFDMYGSMQKKFYDTLPLVSQQDYNYLSNTSLFQTTAYMATCDGIKFYLKIWAALTQKQKDNLLKFIRDPSNVTLTDQAELPKTAFSILEPMVERAMFQKMNGNQKLSMCKNLTYVDCFTRVAIDRNIDCGKLLLASGTADAKTIQSLLDVRNCSNWDKDQWNLTMKYSPEILDMDCLKNAPPDVMIDNVDSLAQHCNKLDKRTINILANITTSKLMNDTKNGKPLTTTQKNSLSDLLTSCGADPSFMGNLMTKSEMLSKVDFSKTDTKDGIQFMKNALQSVKPKDLKKDQIVNSFKMMMYNRSILMELNTTELMAAVCEICDKSDSFDSADLAKLADVVFKRIPTLADPSTYTDSILDCIGPLLQFLPMKSFDKISNASLSSAITGGKMKNVTITSKNMGKKVLDTAKSALKKSNGAFTSSDLDNIGSGVIAMYGSDIDKIPTVSFTDSVIELFATNIKKTKNSDFKPPKAMISSLVTKIKSSPSCVKKAIESGLGDNIPTEYLKNAAISDLPDITGETSEVTIEVDAKRARFLVDKLKSKIGVVNGADTNFTLQRLSNIKNIACGLTIDDIKNIPNDAQRADKLNAITKSPCITQEQADEAMMAYKNCTNFAASSSSEVESQTDSETLSEASPKLLSQFSYTDLKKFGTSNRDAIVSAISKADTDVLSKERMKDGFKFIMEARGKSTSGVITVDDLDAAGNLICGIDTSALSRLDSDALDEYSTKIEKCPLGATERQTLASSAMQKLNLKDGSKVDAAGVMRLGTLVSEMSEAQLDSVDKSMLCDMADKIVSAFKEKEEKDTQRKKKGFKMDTTSNDDSTYTANKQRVMKKLLSVQDSCSSTSSGASGRRKRSATSLTCAYMRSIGVSGLSALTLDQINIMGNTEFTDCIDILGAVTDYSEDQKKALADVGKRDAVWGNPANWTANTVYSAGVIVQGLTLSELDTLNLDLDAISKLGEFNGWTDAQKKTIFERWLKLSKSNNASTITSNELMSLGHMTCGAGTNHIALIPVSVYTSAADSIGELTSCSDAQLSSFATLAKAAFGNVTSWSTTIVANVGLVIGGLSTSELSSLSEAQINAIDSNLISYIPATAFSAFTATQIATFSTSQAQSTTVSQRSALNSGQLSALSTVAGTTFSGCDIIRTSWSLAVFLTFLSMWFGRN